MKYSFDSRVRYSEIGEDKKLTLNSIYPRQNVWDIFGLWKEI